MGAGNIAAVHAEALRLFTGAELTSVIDPRLSAANRLAQQFDAGHVYRSVEEGIEAGQFDAAHVLVPPDLHAKVAKPLLEAGIDVLLEKPMATSSADCDEMLRLAEVSGARIGVNQNFVFDTTFRKMLDIINSGRAGKLRSVTCIYSMPLRQLSAGQLNHWMFREPKNLLLEQAVHPLSQIIRLIGSIDALNVTAADVEELAPDTRFAPWLLAHLQGAEANAQFEFRMGTEFSTWQIVAICDDATLTADMISSTLTFSNRTRWLEPMDRFLGGLKVAGSRMLQATAGLAAYGLAMLKLRPRSDAFFKSMRGSHQSHYAALRDGGQQELGGAFGRDIVALCEKLAEAANWPGANVLEVPLNQSGTYDVLVIGGTGFIGRAVVGKLLEEGKRVGVMARSISGLGSLFYNHDVVVVRGDMASEADLEEAISRTSVVVNLAHGGGGESWEAISEAMVGGARRVAETCLKHNVTQFIHVSSIAGLNLGQRQETITAETLPDGSPESRADYSRAKVDADKMLLELCKSRSLPLTILRPGLVVGRGGTAFHTGVGFFNNEQHFLGWNAGHNPLPFVLVDDVADAIVACIGREGIVGRAYNLVGDVRWSARKYVDELAAGLGRPIKFHPQPTFALYLVERAKWIIKRVAGKKQPGSTLYDLKSRSLLANFDCHIEKHDLGWRPVASEDAFRAEAIFVHGDAATGGRP